MTLLAGLLAGHPAGGAHGWPRSTLTIAAGTIVMRRRGYGVGGNTRRRCHGGHLFTTIWIPAASLKSLRFGWWRFQRCPVGRHWTLVHPVREADLTEDERRRRP